MQGVAKDRSSFSFRDIIQVESWVPFSHSWHRSCLWCCLSTGGALGRYPVKLWVLTFHVPPVDHRGEPASSLAQALGTGSVGREAGLGVRTTSKALAASVTESAPGLPLLMSSGTTFHFPVLKI